MLKIREDKKEKSEEKHFWGGQEMPAHLDNIKEWQINCGDDIENILMNAIKEICSMTYGTSNTEADEEEECLWPIVKEVMPVLIKEMRDNGIYVWNPEADCYDF